MEICLITGGSGFLGKELIKRLYDNDKPIRILARNEGNLVALKQQFSDVEIMTGDIANSYTVKKALVDVTEVYHLAAIKHIGIAEKQPYECVLTNIMGTMNLLKHFKGDLFVAISTDKAAQVQGVYGASKFLMEKLIADKSLVRYNTKYRVVRYGNVLYSTGSVLCKWKALIEAGEMVTITDPDATRFFWTVDQAVDLIFECIENAEDATPYVPEMKAMSMGNVFYAMMEKYSKNAFKYTYNEIGLQPGENKHETMDGITFSNDVEQFTIEEIKKLI